ncbi:MAG TPA: hypothetical protein PK517_03020 [Nitrosomonas sp.]|nr:hypothetical protein [Nitrosomonas sp.]
MENKLPKGYALKLLKSCELGAKNKLIGMYSTEGEAEAKTKSLGCSLSVFQILDIYGNRTLTAK